MINLNRSFFLLKPDGVSNKLYPRITRILEKNNITIVKTIFVSPDIDHWKQHYIEHSAKSFYEELCTEMASKPVIAMLVETSSSESCWKICREMLGNTDPKKAAENTIRYKYGTSVRQNVAHTSDSAESAERELQLWKLV